MGCSCKRRSKKPWIVVILILLAVLLALIAWAVLGEPTCSGGICPTEPSPAATEVLAPSTQETLPEPTTQPPTTEPSTEPPTTEPSTEPPTTESPTTESSTEPPTTDPTTEPPTTEPTTEPSTEPPTTDPTTVPETETMRVVTPVSVLSRPEEDAQVLETLSIGQQVSVTDRQEDWCSLELEGGTGYVPAWALRDPDHYLVVIDPGHQGKGNREKEPIGPGAKEKKAKVASGTQGVATGIPEYELTLEVSLLLQSLLQEQGCEVMMIRTHHDVNISNAERAQMANEVYADAFVRIHANGDSNPDTNGIMTLCQTKTNPYNADLHPYSYALSELVLDEMLAATDAKRQFIWETDTMSGINWCRVPVTIVEMGYMSNPQEDRLMATEEYRQSLAQGIAEGILQYLEEYC